jgi:putative transposase
MMGGHPLGRIPPNHDPCWGEESGTHQAPKFARGFRRHSEVGQAARRGLVTHHVLFVVHHATRAAHIAGITTNPDSSLMAQVARNLTSIDDGFLNRIRFLILDLDTKFTAQFKRILKDAGVDVVNTAYQAPNMNAIAERWVLSVKSECINRMILFGEESLRRALRQYTDHYHAERPHEGIGNELIAAAPQLANHRDLIVEDERLGGLLRSYQRAA